MAQIKNAWDEWRNNRKGENAAPAAAEGVRFDDVELDEVPYELGDVEADVADEHELGDGPEDGDTFAPELDVATVSIIDSTVMPPERVRFATAVELRRDHGDPGCKGALLNLSNRGAACTTELELSPGERVWMSFRLGLADEPITLLCVVLWRRELDAEHPIYGVEFKSLSGEETDKLDAVVHERSQGKAAEWPLPHVPVDEPGTTKNPPAWLSAAAGMAAGIGLALALSALTRVDTPRLPAPVVVAPPADEATLTVTPSAVQPPVLQPAMAQPDLVAPGTDSPVAAPPASVRPTTATIASPTEPVLARAAPVAATPSVSASPTAPAPSTPASASAQHITGTRIVPAKGGGLMTLTLDLEGKASAPKGFWLTGPRRYVIDVAGRPTKLTQKSYTVDSQLATGLRIGEHGGKTRFVLEVTDAAGKNVKLTSRGSAVLVTLERR